MKIGRNDKCWCGSGKKYKRCHYGREYEEPVQLWEAASKMRKAFSSRVCSVPPDMHPSCSGDIIKAHTVPKSTSLSKIAKNGHVYAFVFDLMGLEKNNGVLKAELVGVNRASTFTGFCSGHDSKLFSPLELHDFTASQEQCFLLAYRAYARERYTKRAAAVSANNNRDMDKGKEVGVQKTIQSFAKIYDDGLSVALDDMNSHERRFDSLLLSGDYSTVRAYVIDFDGPPPVMCSGTYAPEVDFDGNQLQDLNDFSVVPSVISITSFYGGKHGHFVAVWLPEDDSVCLPFIRSLNSIQDGELSSALVRLMFEYFENVHISPEWWDSLSKSHQSALESRMMQSALPLFSFPSPSGRLKADQWAVSAWPVRGKQWIGTEP